MKKYLFLYFLSLAAVLGEAVSGTVTANGTARLSVMSDEVLIRGCIVKRSATRNGVEVPLKRLKSQFLEVLKSEFPHLKDVEIQGPLIYPVARPNRPGMGGGLPGMGSGLPGMGSGLPGMGSGLPGMGSGLPGMGRTRINPFTGLPMTKTPDPECSEPIDSNIPGAQGAAGPRSIPGGIPGVVPGVVPEIHPLRGVEQSPFQWQGVMTVEIVVPVSSDDLIRLTDNSIIQSMSHSLSFVPRVADKKKMESKVHEMAFKHAAQKAENLASLGNKKMGELVSISEVELSVQRAQTIDPAIDPVTGLPHMGPKAWSRNIGKITYQADLTVCFKLVD